MNDEERMENEMVIDQETAAVDIVQETMQDFIASADVNRVYGEPMQHGDQLIIPTAEVLVGMGFGAGFGSGFSGGEESEDQGTEGPSGGGGGGGGGGGKTLSRPVAVIVASPDGVRVEPVVDATKIALAAFTAAGFILATLFRMIKPDKKLRNL